MEFIKANYATQSFDIVEFFKESGIRNRDEANSLFKNLIKSISLFPDTEKNKDIRRFASKIMQTNFALLENPECYTYWNDIMRENTTNKRVLSHFIAEDGISDAVLHVSSKKNKIAHDTPEEDTVTDVMPRLLSPDAELQSMMPCKMFTVMSPIRLPSMNLETNSSLVVNNINFTTKFTHFKRYSYHRLEKDEIHYFDELFNETLAISHILFLDPSTYNVGLTRSLERNDLKVLERHLKQTRKPASCKRLHEILDLLNDMDDIKHCIHLLTKWELEAITDNDDSTEHMIVAIKHIMSILPTNHMNYSLLEHELRDSYINPILNLFFSAKDVMQYRSPETNLPERIGRSEFTKRPDAVVSTIDNTHFSYTRLVGEVKNDTYDMDSMLVLYDKYRLSIYGKDIVDNGVKTAVLYQAIGFKLYFYKCSLIEDGFYAIVLLFDIMLPSSLTELPSFAFNMHKLYQIRDILQNECCMAEGNCPSNWKRETLDTPVLEEYLKTNSNHVPSTKRKHSIDESYVHYPN